MVTLTINDETMTGTIQSSLDISFDTALVTVKDIIEARVKAEVANYNMTLLTYFNGLVQPTNAERTLNGYKMRERKQIDAEKQVYIALNAFQNNAFFVLINNCQAETLTEEMSIDENSSVSFVKLTPLVGG